MECFVGWNIAERCTPDGFEIATLFLCLLLPNYVLYAFNIGGFGFSVFSNIL